MRCIDVVGLLLALIAAGISIPLRVTFSFILLGYIVFGFRTKHHEILQAEADNTAHVVINPNPFNAIGRAFNVAVLAINLATTSIAGFIFHSWKLPAYGAFLLLLGTSFTYLASCNYWPMTGQTLWSKIKASLTIRKTANA